MALTELEFVEKMKAGTATVEEAISFARSRPTISSNAKKRIGALTSGFKKMGLDITMPYKDLKDDKVLKLFTKENSPDKSNRAPNLQALENNIKGLFGKYAISGVMEKVPGSDIEVAMYPQLTGTGTVAGTQRTGMAGERPMRGLLPMEDFAKIYAEAVPLIQEEYGQATADLAKYHATTSHRPSQLQGLKKSDVTVSGNTITVAGKKVTKTDKKGRPPLTFDLDSPTGQLLKRNLDSTKSEFLFDTSTANFDDAFAKHITPRLEQYSELLPLAEIKVEGPDGIRLSEKPVTTPSAIRSIVPKIMLDQYNIPEALVQGVMGHVNDSILRKNYAGIAPSTDIPKLLENPSSFAVGDFGTTPKNINIDLLSDEDRAALIEDQKLTIIEEEKAKRATAGAAIAEAQAQEIKSKASVTPEDIARAAEVDVEKVKADELRRIQEKEIREQVRVEQGVSKNIPVENPMPGVTPELEEQLKKDGVWEAFKAKAAKAGNILPSAFAGTMLGNALYNLAEDPEEFVGYLTRDAVIEGALRAMRFANPVQAASTMIIEPMAQQATPEQSMMQPELIYAEPDGKFVDPKLELMRRQSVIQKNVNDMSRIATEDAGFVTTNREPEATPVTDSGFLNMQSQP